MLVQPSSRSSPVTDFAPAQRKRSVSVLRAPRQNRLLAALPVEEYGRLLPYLEPLPLPRDWVVHGAGDREKYVYFLTAGIVSRFYLTGKRESTLFAVTGNEGVIGVSSFLSGANMRSQSVVLSAGYAYRLDADLLKNEFAHGGPLSRLLLRYTHALIAQIGQIAACNRLHMLEQQLCRWYLSCLDRVPSNKLTMTQEVVANMLGVRREGVTEAARKLQEAGLIHTGRGYIAVIDRRGLEARACECYAVIKREYDRLQRWEENLGNAGEHGMFQQHYTARPELM